LSSNSLRRSLGKSQNRPITVVPHEAKQHPEGIRTYLEENDIDYQAYHRQLGSQRQLHANQQPTHVQSLQKEPFAPVEVVDQTVPLPEGNIPMGCEMITPSPNVRIFVCTKPADMRCSFRGLFALTSSLIKQDPYSGALFLFRNRRGFIIRPV
jgi:hypothetical protein